MKNKINLIEETNRMRDLFGYKAGKVISEQLENKRNIQEEENPNFKDYEGPVDKDFIVGGKLGRDASADLNAAKKEYKDDNFKTTFIGAKRPDDSTSSFKIQQKDLQKIFCSVKNGKLTVKDKDTEFYYILDNWSSWAEFYEHNYNQKIDGGYISLNDTMLALAAKSCPNSELGKKYSFLIDKNQPGGSKNQPGGSKSVIPKIPEELVDINGVKKFQVWLNTQTPTWVNGKTLEFDSNRGYGKFGPLTSASWNKLKDIYLKEIGSLQANQKVVANPETTKVAPAQAARIGQTAAPVTPAPAPAAGLTAGQQTNLNRIGQQLQTPEQKRAAELEQRYGKK